MNLVFGQEGEINIKSPKGNYGKDKGSSIGGALGERGNGQGDVRETHAKH